MHMFDTATLAVNFTLIQSLNVQSTCPFSHQITGKVTYTVTTFSHSFILIFP